MMLATRRSLGLGLLVLAALAAGCAAPVALDNRPPVEDRTGTPVGRAADASAAASANAVPSRNVAPVQVAPPNVATGANAPRIIYFDLDSFVIKPEFQAAIEQHARFLAANKARKVAVQGHTDERGGREYNLALGQKRAEAVRRALSLLGVADDQVEAVSFGKEKPAVQGNDEAAWAQNRRAEIVYR
jgi:peptidoglycan-associated lipoprotein